LVLPDVDATKDIIADHFSGNPRAGRRVTYPIRRFYSHLPGALIDLNSSVSAYGDSSPADMTA
jgi:hypothetical protein